MRMYCASAYQNCRLALCLGVQQNKWWQSCSEKGETSGLAAVMALFLCIVVETVVPRSRLSSRRLVAF
ncbi:hypothetical protein Ancab_031275 [Ancistrocladus abbreviatus]